MKKTFDQWMKEVDAILVSKIGMESADLPDINYADHYEDGASPRSVAAIAFRYANSED